MLLSGLWATLHNFSTLSFDVAIGTSHYLYNVDVYSMKKNTLYNSWDWSHMVRPKWPELKSTVALETFTTHGRPYSRATTAPETANSQQSYITVHIIHFSRLATYPTFSSPFVANLGILSWHTSNTILPNHHPTFTLSNSICMHHH